MPYAKEYIVLNGLKSLKVIAKSYFCSFLSDVSSLAEINFVLSSSSDLVKSDRVSTSIS